MQRAPPVRCIFFMALYDNWGTIIWAYPCGNFYDNKDNTIGALTANSIPVRNWKSVKNRRKKPWKSVNFLCFIPWKSVKKRRKKPWKSVICRSLCPVYKQNIAIYIITRTITDVHGRHGELLHDSSCVSYFR